MHVLAERMYWIGSVCKSVKGRLYEVKGYKLTSTLKDCNNVIIVYHSILQLLIRESRENKQVQELPERLCKTASRYVSKC